MTETTTSIPAVESELQPAPASDATTRIADPAAELRRYMQTFGDSDGAKYFSEGRDFNQAALQHLSVLRERMALLEADCQARIAKAEERAAEAEDRLKSMNTGEPTAIDTGAPARGEKQAGTGWNSMFKQRADDGQAR